MSKGDTAWQNKYGIEFLELLAAEADWRAVEALWRWGSPADLPAVAEVMAQSQNGTLAMLLGVELTTARYVDQLPTLPDLLYRFRPTVSAEVAKRVLDRLNDTEKPIAAPYAAGAHLLIAWLMNQPGAELDDLAIEVALGGHAFSETPQPLESGLARIARSPALGARLVQDLTASSDRWTTGAGWTRAADMTARSGTNPKGRADLVRSMTNQLLELPSTEAVEPPHGFLSLMERHAANQLLVVFDGVELASTPGTTAAVRAIAGFVGSVKDDLVASVAAHQPTLWAALRGELVAGWSTDDWERMLTRWAVPGTALLDAGQVIAAAPAETALHQIRVAVIQGTAPGDEAATVATAALKGLSTDADGEPDAEAVVVSVPWDLVTTDAELQYIHWLLDTALTPAAVCAAVVGAYEARHLSAEAAAALTPESEWGNALCNLTPGPERAQYAAALIESDETERGRPILRAFIDASNDTFDVVEAIAPQDCSLAFESFDEERWHNLDAAQKDRLLDLLEQHATLEQSALLDTIAGDSDGPNANRRARAAKRWAALTSLHSMIPPGVLSLLESAQITLNQAFAEVAVSVQPRDEGTLVSLQDKWLSGGKTGASARAALDTVAEGLVMTLRQLRPPERRDQCPALLHLLGVAAATSSFETLISYVGADAVDDNAALRRAAASAIRAFVDVQRIDGEQMDALGARLSSETDPAASDDLRTALAAANLGDDAAILGLYNLANLNPAEVTAMPDELFGGQKNRLLMALKKMRVQQALGEAGWDGYVEQMDLVGEALVRTAYLRFGGSEPLKKQIASNKHNEPDYGALVKAFDNAPGFSPASANLQTIHNIRATRTAAHHPSGGALDAGTVAQSESALGAASQAILERLIQDQPVLRAVPASAAVGDGVS